MSERRRHLLRFVAWSGVLLLALANCAQFQLAAFVDDLVVAVNVNTPASVVALGTNFNVLTLGVTAAGDESDVTNQADWISTNARVLQALGSGTFSAVGIGEARPSRDRQAGGRNDD